MKAHIVTQPQIETWLQRLDVIETITIPAEKYYIIGKRPDKFILIPDCMRKHNNIFSFVRKSFDSSPRFSIHGDEISAPPDYDHSSSYVSI